MTRIPVINGPDINSPARPLIFNGMMDCQNCALAQTPRIRVVPGWGHWPSKIMWVAQSPGGDEAYRGKPLIGKSGQLHREIMHECGMELDDYYYTNVNLCHPPGDRKCTRKEINACAPWLTAQVLTVDPDIIVCMGDTAYKSFLPDETSSITQIRGNAFKRVIHGRERIVVPIFHPAFVARNQPAYRPVYARDLMAIKAILETGDVPAAPEPFTKVKSPWEEVLAAAQSPKFGFDLEFDGEHKKRKVPVARHATIVGIGVCATPGQAKYYPCPDPEEARKRILELQPYLEDPARIKVVSNVKAEAEVLHNYGINIVNYRDTLIEAWLLGADDYQQEIPKALKDAWHQRFGTEMIRIESILGKGKTARGMTQASLDDEDAVVEYAAQDPDASLRLHEIFYPMIVERGIENLYLNIEMPFTDVIVEMEEAGMEYDPEVAENFAYEQIQDAIRKQTSKLTSLVGYEFNPRSYVQAAKALFGPDYTSGRIPTPRWDPNLHKAPPTDKVTLAAYIGDPVVQGILEWRALAKFRSLIENQLTQFIEADQKIHCEITQTGTSTGRVAQRNPNLQNIPARQRDDVSLPIDPMLVRSAFIAGYQNYIYAPDLSQIEMRIAAHMSNDQEMIHQLSDPKGDLHSNTARRIFHTNLDALTAAFGVDEAKRRWKNMRYLAKTVGFGVLYGLTAGGLLLRTPTLGLTLAEATGFIEAFYQAYPQLKSWQDRVRQAVRDQGWFETMLGRRRYFPNVTANDRKLQAEALNACVNFPVQGGAADFFKIATLNAKRVLVERDFRTGFINQVHDEIVMEGPWSELHDLAKYIPPAMSGAIKLSVPVPVDFEFGYSWGDLHGYAEALDKYGYDALTLGLAA